MKYLALIILSVLTIACNNQSSPKTDTPKDEPSVIYGSKKAVQKSRRAVQVMQPQKFHLNSDTKIGGKDRIAIFIDLPKNTIEWYYSVVTVKDKTNSSGVNLQVQLSGLLNKTTITISNIKVPTGTSICDVYLMDRENMDKFNNSEKFTYDMRGSRENFMSGVVQLENNPKYCFLGFKNPRTLHAIDFTLEVVAIVEE
jgi:hypothetical protein